MVASSKVYDVPFEAGLTRELRSASLTNPTSQPRADLLAQGPISSRMNFNPSIRVRRRSHSLVRIAFTISPALRGHRERQDVSAKNLQQICSDFARILDSSTTSRTNREAGRRQARSRGVLGGGGGFGAGRAVSAQEIDSHARGPGLSPALSMTPSPLQLDNL